VRLRILLCSILNQLYLAALGSRIRYRIF